MESYLQHIRSQIVPKRLHTERYSLMDSGGEFRSISETMEKVGKSYGYNLPTVTFHKMAVTLKGLKTKGSEEL